MAPTRVQRKTRNKGADNPSNDTGTGTTDNTNFNEADENGEYSKGKNKVLLDEDALPNLMKKVQV